MYLRFYVSVYFSGQLKSVLLFGEPEFFLENLIALKEQPRTVLTAAGDVNP